MPECGHLLVGSVLMHTHGDQSGVEKRHVTRGGCFRRVCAACRWAWFEGYQISAWPGTPFGIAPPHTCVYVCPRCRGGGGLIIIPGQVTM